MCMELRTKHCAKVQPNPSVVLHTILSYNTSILVCTMAVERVNNEDDVDTHSGL